MISLSVSGSRARSTVLRGAGGTRAVAPSARLGVMPGLHLGNPSLRAALDPPAVQIDRKLHGTTYRLLYQDTEEAGQVRCHPVSNSDGNSPLAIIREPRRPDGVGAARRRAGPNYICSNQDAWCGACGRRRPAARDIGGSET